MAHKEPYSKSYSLTNAELEVLTLLAEGRSAKEIALILCKSAHTVRVQKSSLYAKLEVRNQAQAVLRYFEICQ